MSQEERIDELILELLETGATPEAVCEDCPELLPEVRRGWKEVCALETEINSWFPTSDTDGYAESPECAADEMPQIPGYEMLEVLGRGGAGVVYLARHSRLDRPVAVKMLLAGRRAKPRELDRFWREVKALAGLRHPNIVPIYDVGDHDGRLYFTMEFLEGGSLAKKLKGNPLPALKAARLVATLADGIHAAHENGIVHRDLSPSNILFTADGTPRITDFGLARRLNDDSGLTLSGMALGTPGYMAPEQAGGRSDNVGPRADVYALGAMLYKMLTGRPPFQAETTTATIQQLLSEEPVPPSQLNSRTPRDLETICLKCLSKEPQERYESAASVADDLRRFERGEPIAARRIGPVGRLARWARRRPALAIAWAMWGAVIVGLSVVFLAGGGLGPAHRVPINASDVHDLKIAVELQNRGDLSAAAKALEKIRLKVDDNWSATAQAQLKDSLVAQQNLTRLESIRLDRLTLIEGRGNRLADVAFANTRADQAYHEALLNWPSFDPNAPPETVAAAIKGSSYCDTIRESITDWTVCCSDDHRMEWLLTVLRLVDPDPWRDRVRNPVTWSSAAALEKLATAVEADRQPISLLIATGQKLQFLGKDGIAVVKRAVQRSPQDFWANFTLARTLHDHARLENADSTVAAGYYNKVLAIRPNMPAVLNDLGLVRFERYQLIDSPGEYGDGALTIFRRALIADPRFVPALNNFGLALKSQGNWDQATPYLQAALAIDPECAPAHVTLAEILSGRGQIQDGIDHYRQALKIDPKFVRAYCNLGIALAAKSRRDRVDQLYDPGNRVLDAARGNALGESVRRYDEVFNIYPDWTIEDNAVRMSDVDLARLQEAIGHYQRASELSPPTTAPAQFKPLLAKTHAALGQALAAQWNFAAAEPAFRSSLNLDPPSFETWPANVKKQIARCERMSRLESRLAAIMAGTIRPTDDWLPLAQLCYVRRHYATAADFYAKAIAASKEIADDYRAGHRFNAACAAALAGAGNSDDAAGRTDAEKQSWRRQAHEWLKRDLAHWTERLTTGGAAGRADAGWYLTTWRQAGELATLRDQPAIDQLPPDEREEWRGIWRRVDALIEQARPPSKEKS